jgi:hypothetical protein
MASSLLKRFYKRLFDEFLEFLKIVVIYQLVFSFFKTTLRTTNYQFPFLIVTQH